MTRRNVGVLLAMGALLLAACDTSSSSTIGSTATPPVELTTTSLRTEPGGASVDPQPEESTTTTEVQEPTTPFVGGEEPIFGARTFDWAANFIVPGPIVESDGILYMFYVGHAVERPNLTRGQVGVATSADGRDWAFTNDQPLFDGTEVDWTEAGVYPSSVTILDDGTWAIWFSVIPRAFSSRAVVIGRATAPGPDGPWTIDPEPVLVGGGEGTWNAKGVTHPSVVRVGDEYWMYFDGHVDDIETERDRAIGLATSADGVTWELYNDPDTGGIYAQSDPVLFPAPAEEWDGGRVMAPSVVETDEGYVMVYLSSKRRSDRPGFPPGHWLCHEHRRPQLAARLDQPDARQSGNPCVHHERSCSRHRRSGVPVLRLGWVHRSDHQRCLPSHC